MKKGEPGVASFLFALGAVTVGLSLDMGVGTLRSMGSGFFPFALGLALMVLSVVYGAQLLVAARKAGMGAGRGGATTGQPAATPTRPARAWAARLLGALKDPLAQRVLLSIGILALVALTFARLGYLLSSFVAVLLFLRLLGARNWLVSVGMAAATALTAYVVFVKLLGVFLPRGILSF